MSKFCNILNGTSRLFLFVAIGLVSLLGGCTDKKDTKVGNTPPSGASLTKVTLILNWYPEAEHGGYYAALVHDIYKKHGLDVEIRPGGRSVVVAPELALGRVQFGIGNADDVLMSRSESTDLVALMAPLQTGPRCIMVREDSGITSFEQLKNIKLQIDPSRPYIPFLKSKGLLDSSVQTTPYFGSVAELVAGPGVGQQAYSFSEPLMAEQQGVKVRNLMMSEIGYNPYACCLIASGEYVSKNEEIVRKMVKASVEGWQKYLESPTETNEYILKQNKQGMTAEALTYGVEKLKPLCIPEGFDASKLGTMTLDRWKTLQEQLVSLKLINAEKTAPEKSFDDRFLK